MKIIIAFLMSFLLGGGAQSALSAPSAQSASDEAVLYLDAARMSMQHQDWAQAEERLLKVMKLNFHDLTARYLLAKTAEQRGDLRLAKKRYKMVLFIDKKHLLSLIGWAQIAEQLNDDDRLVAYQRVMQLEPNKVLWHLKVAQFYMQKKSIKAERYLNNVLSLDPNHRQGLQLMIQYHQQYAIAAHAKVFQQRLNDLDATPQSIIPNKTRLITKNIIFKKKHITSNDMKHALIHMQHHDWMKAESQLLKIVNRDFKHVKARFLLAEIAEQHGELRLANKRYKMVLFINKNHQPALIGWARVSEKLKTNEMLVAYQRLIKLDPDHALWHLKVAQFYMNNKPLSAKRYINQVLEIDPNHRQALELMIEFKQKYTLIAHAGVYQRRLDELSSLAGQKKPVLVSYKEDLKAIVHSVQKNVINQQKETVVVSNVTHVKKQPIDMTASKIPPSDISVFQHYVQAAKQGRAHDQYMLGLMYKEGRGVVANHHQALAFMKLAAGQELDKAQLTLGLMLYEGIGSKKKQREAIQWLTHAAKQGMVDALYSLGLIYATNKTFKNDKKAVKYWKTAAAQNHAKSQHNLAVMYFKGQGVKKSRAKAQYWLQLEAQHNKPDTTVNIDHLYSEGKHRQLN